MPDISGKDYKKRKKITMVKKIPFSSPFLTNKRNEGKEFKNGDVSSKRYRTKHLPVQEGPCGIAR